MNDDNITRVKLDPKNVSHGKTDWEKVAAMTEGKSRKQPKQIQTVSPHLNKN